MSQNNSGVSPSTAEHRRDANRNLCVSILTVSDTRTEENDLGGKLILDLCCERGIRVHQKSIVADELDLIRDQVRRFLEIPECQSVLVTGGTGLAKRDCTPEAIESLYDAFIPGYGELFRMLSFQEIGTASMLSRASAGRVGTKVIFTMPGSPNGVRLAMEKIILPELAHLVHHAGK